jgi:hypothetical protein
MAVIQVRLSSMSEAPSFDIGDGAFFNSAFAVYLCFKFFYEILQTYVYWLMAEIARTTGILRSWESIGSTIAYAVGATHWPNQNQMILGFALWAVTVPFTLLAVFGNWNVGGSEIQAKEEDSDPEMQTVVADARMKE